MTKRTMLLAALVCLAACVMTEEPAPEPAPEPEFIDSDGDGWEDSSDCAPDDPTVHPGAVEACNGRDDDCDGEVPPDERDEDGDASAPCDGDCDDEDAQRHPGALELCDRVDGDCDGVLPREEQDGDEDGLAPCEGDCDDGDPEVRPGARERCNDIDDDCDGELPDYEENERPDGDGDGYTLCDFDCDDEDPEVFPDAPEQADRKDNDCSGVVDDCPWTGPGPSGVLDPSSAFAEFEFLTTAAYLGEQVGGPGDTNGDGYDDILVSGHGSDAYLYYGPFCPGVYTSALADVVFERGPHRSGYGNWKHNLVGDLNGDGFAEVHVGSLVYFGPPTPTATGAGGQPRVPAADADLAFVGQGLTSPGDVDGDGSPDLIGGVMPLNQPGTIRVYLGPLTPTAGTPSVPVDHLLTSETVGDHAGISLAPLGDIDGDGTADFAIGAPHLLAGGVTQPGAVYIVTGPITQDIALANAYAKLIGAAGDELGFGVGTTRDTNDDGLPELLIGAAASRRVYRLPSPIPAGVRPVDSVAEVLVDVPVSTRPGRTLSQAAVRPLATRGIVGAVKQALLLDGPPADPWSLPTHPDRIVGVINTPSRFLGTSLSLVGDLNADGYGDFILGAEGGNALLWLGGP